MRKLRKTNHCELKWRECNKYLGSLAIEDGRDKREIKTRIAMGREAFNNLERVLRDT